MDTLTFISELLKSLSWPLFAIVIGLVFRKPLIGLFPALRKLKYGKLEAEFESKIQDIDAKKESIPVYTEKKTARSRSAIDQLRTTLLFIAKESPSAAILEAWRNIEFELYRICRSRHPERRNIPAWFAIDSLHKEAVIDNDMKSILQQLSIVRNEAAHPKGILEIGEAQAIIYAQSATRVLQYIENIK